MAWGNSLFEISAVEAEKKYKENNIAVIPTGSLEQHGPHLPMGTDAMAGIAFGKRVAEKLMPCSCLSPCWGYLLITCPGRVPSR
jgi:creatinine amidohydrolase/Fe(II)-dependent formamide hydrolase-like protein